MALIHRLFRLFRVKVLTMGCTLNLETLGALRELDEPGASSFLDEIIDAYILDTASRIHAVVAAAKAGDFRAIAELAHTIKGASLNLGADELALMMQSMVQDAENKVPCAPGKLGEIENHFRGVTEALLAYKGL
jgi:HPt (histidine-containing phosphotransfer) domain-containing protein